MADLPKPASTGNGYPAFKFATVGDKIKATLTSDPNVVNRPKPNSNETEEQLVFEVRTEAGEDFTIWVKVKSQQYRALYDAVKANGEGAKLEEGDTVALQFTGTKDVGKPSPMKEFAAAHAKGAPKPQAGQDGQPSVADLLG